jgi:hypothetical protein
MMRATPVEERVHQVTGERLRALENLIELEWSGLRRVHEDAVRELRDHAQALSQVSIAATTSSIAGLERAEARLAEIDASLAQRVAALSEQLAGGMTEMRAPTPAAAGPVAAAPVPVLETLVAARPPVPMPPPNVEHSEDRSPDVLLSRLALLENKMAAREVALQAAVGQGARAKRVLRITAVGIALLLPSSIAGWIAADRARDAEGRAQAAVVAAGQQVAAVRRETATQAEAACDTGRTETLIEVLAAPDLVRYNVTGVDENKTAGQLLWSRSRGVVFTALRVPPLPADVTYELWLMTDEAPVAVGMFRPDGGGRVTFATDPPRSPRPVVGASITIEPIGGSPRPSTRVLARTRLGP